MRSLRPVGPAALLMVAAGSVLAGPLPPAVRYGPLLVSVVVLGMPHGAVDHVAVAAALRGETEGNGGNDGVAARVPGLDSPLARALAAVAVLYAVAGGGYLAVWTVAPVAAAAVFLLLTWLHWGQGDLYHLLASGGGAHLRSRGDRALSLLVRGGLPMLVPLLTFPGVYRRVLRALSAVFVATARVPAWPFSRPTRVALGAGFAAVTLLSLGWSRRGATTPEARRAWRVDAAEVSLLWGYFLLVPPILAIGAYFTLWHSLRHVRRVLALESAHGTSIESRAYRGVVGELDGSSLRRFGTRALPNTVGGLALFAAIYWLSATRGDLLAVAAAYLVAIAVLTLPHTAVVTWIDGRQGVWHAERE
jgi:Brp/Blh family beta-carotene 15,15'-monooxygenase